MPVARLTTSGRTGAGNVGSNTTITVAFIKQKTKISNGNKRNDRKHSQGEGVEVSWAQKTIGLEGRPIGGTQ